MKRMLVLILAFSFCMPLYVYAASIGKAETAGQGKLSIGFDQEFLFDRDMKKNTDHNGEFTPDLEFYRSMARISYGLFNNLDVYAKLGTADFKGNSNMKYFDTGFAGGVDIGKWKQNGKNAFAYGFGIKGNYDLQDGWIIGCDAQYITHKNKFTGTESWDAYDGSGVYQYSRSYPIKGDMLFQEWQAAIYVAKKIDKFTPYVGGKYSDLRIKNKMQFHESSDKFTYKSKADDNFGVFAGLDINIIEHFNLNVEGRFIDETAMSFGASYRF
jgi:hypothetical protein